jgi:hypothetical protein
MVAVGDHLLWIGAEHIGMVEKQSETYFRRKLYLKNE